MRTYAGRRKTESNTGRKLLITECAMTAALVLFIALVLGGRVRDDVGLESLRPVLLSEMSDPGNMQEAGAMKLRSLYGLSGNDYEEVLLYVPASNMDAQELLLVRCRTEEQAGEVKRAMEQRNAYLRGIFESYGVEQMALIDRAVIDVRGKYCLYVSAVENAKVDAAFRQALKGRRR